MLCRDQKEKVLQVVRFGCDRATACDFVDCTLRELEQALAGDNAFQSEYRRAAAAAEVHRMKVINEAAEEVKNWRAATWWFERRDSERFAAQGDSSLKKELAEVVQDATALVQTTIDDPRRREQLCERLAAVQSRLGSTPQRKKGRRG